MHDATGFDGVKPSREAATPLRFAGLVLDLDACTLARESGEAIALTRGERALLRMFVARPGRVISRDSLLDSFANRRFEPFDRSVDVLVGKLRRKIEADPKKPRLIVTVPGEGYRFDGLRFAPPQTAKLADADSAASPEATPIAADASKGARRPAGAPPRAAERRHVTALAAELVWAEGDPPNDPEDLRVVIDTFRRSAAEALSRYGGAIGESRGHEIAAYFGHRQAQENDAERAVRAALAIQSALSESNAHGAGGRAPQFAARIGLHSGLVVVDAMGEVFGDAPNVAARVQALADPGTVLITARVHRQVAGLFIAEDRGAHELKGAPEPTTLFRIARASGGRRFGARALTPLVGREEELDLLRRRWERAAGGEGQFVQIVGEPGIGKSRLVEEFRLRLGERPHTFVEWSSSQLLQNTPLHPIAEWGRQRFGGAETAARQRLTDLENTLRLIGLDPAEYAPLLAPLVDIPLPRGEANLASEELRRRQLAAIVSWVLAGARSQPVVLAFEDLQWADPTSIDLIRALAERGGQAPLLLLATSRPEFRPPWSLRPHHGVISLGPLGRAEVSRMVGEIAAHHALAKDVIDGVNERTGGVPLFIEEVTRLLLERGEAGGLQAIPLTLQQSLAARLDQLGEAREVAQIGAVLGRDFTYALLSAVAAVHSPSTDECPPGRPLDRGAAVAGVADPALQSRGIGDSALQSALDRLAETDLLIAEGTGNEANYRFKHALIQDAAYDSLLKSRRQALHRRAAELLRGQPERASAEPEVIAHHFTEAGLDELAIEWWTKAGDQALRRSAFQEAVAHLGKAIAMADKVDGGKTASVSGERRHLHVAYGNALIATRGYGAPETKEAFAKAHESAFGDKHAPERLAADFGLFAASSVRGDLLAMRAHAAAFLSDIELSPDSPQACVAHRAAGITHWFAGEYAEAREHLERALALFKPGRDDDLAFRFGHDAGVAATLYLALTLWPLGDLEDAASLVRTAKARIASLAYIGTRAYGTVQAILFELMLGNCSHAGSDAAEFARITREHDLPFWRAFGVFSEGLASAQSGTAGGGLEDMRRGLELLREQNALMFDGLLKITLAEAEARAGTADRALAILDEALATCDRTGHRSFEAELHRVRGETLLKRDPANPARADEALQTAIAVARRQGTRSFELRAALALAKLYQSTDRPADAHAILAPALEGFSPTPEMPVIAEAISLIERLT
jgi:class 3 adenylate cyclase/predicted ATPase